MTLASSRDYWKRAQRVLAAGPATFSKHWQRFSANVPDCLVSAEGCYVTDMEGHVYIDTIAALGPNLLGVGNPTIDNAVIQQLRQGTAFSLMHKLEVEVAEQICEVIPCAERVRFCLNGSDANNGVIRLARAITGKPHVFYVGYFGFFSDYIATTSMHAGTLTCLKEFNHQYRWDDCERLVADLEAYHQQGRGGVAALILEVPPRPWDEADKEARDQLDWWQLCCHQWDTLFILDEIVTGFRYAMGGAQEYYGITPDLACVGKALGNGYPIAALVGPARYMDQIEQRGVFISSTHGGNVIGLAAAQAVLQELATGKPLTQLHQAGQQIGSGLQALFQQYQLPVTLLGNPARMIIQWHGLPTSDVPITAQMLKTLWLQETVKKNVLFGGPLFPQACMDEAAVAQILDAARYACEVISTALATKDVSARLCQGAIESDVFAQRYR